MTRVRKKSFLIMTILGPLLFAGAIALITWLSLQEAGKQNILVVDELYPVFQQLEKESTENISFAYMDVSLEEAEKMFPESSFTAILYLPKNIDSSDRAILYFKKQPSRMAIRSIERKVEAILEDMKLKQIGIKRSDYKKVRTRLNITPYKFTDKGEAEEVLTEKAFVGFAFAIIIYMFIFMYGVQVMRGVIEEKTNRIVEVIITSVKPFQLMMGKIIGIAMVGLTQFFIWVVLMFSFVTAAQHIIISEKTDKVAIEARMVNQQAASLGAPSSVKADITDITNPSHLINRINWPLMIGLFVFYFLGGYLLYSAMFAAIGAAVDNETDTQQFMLPVTLPLIIAYILSSMMIDNPESPAAFWGSIVPFTSPIVMMVRVAIGIDAGQIWELILSMALLIGGFIFTTWLAGKIYRTGILMYGKKADYKELWKWLRYD